MTSEGSMFPANHLTAGQYIELHLESEAIWVKKFPVKGSPNEKMLIFNHSTIPLPHVGGTA